MYDWLMMGLPQPVRGRPAALGRFPQQKARPNDADRLGEYPASFGLGWESVRQEGFAPPGPGFIDREFGLNS